MSNEIKKDMQNLKSTLEKSDLQHFENEGLANLLPKLYSFFPSNMSGAKILDVGCGPCVIAGIVKQKFDAEVYGVDCDSTFVDQAKAKGIKVYACDLENGSFPFADGSFDCVLFIEVLEHLAKPENCLKEISRVLKSNGILILSTPNLTSLQNRISIFSGKDPLNGNPIVRPYDRHIRLYALNSATQLLSTWFKITRIGYMNPHARKTSKGVGRDFLCYLKKDMSNTMILACQTTK
jgi:methionine biosynthesis protein MetW